DGYTGRRFSAETATRAFTPDHIGVLFVDDLISVTTLKTDEDGDRVYETTWSAADYDLGPGNDPPYTMVELAPLGNYAFPTHRKAVQIAGTWGYSATVPTDVAEACLILSARLYKRKDSPYGIHGNDETGTMQTLPGWDPD